MSPSNLKIGNVNLSSRLLLAPMAGVNCAAFRLLCKDYGAGLVSTPMIVVNDLVKEPERIIKQTCFLREEHPLACQLIGSDSKLAEEATRIIDQYADIIDINLGCPEKDMLALKAGSFFVKHPEQLKKIVKPIIDNTNKPVTAKIRIGWDDKTINAVSVVKQLQDFGVSAITVHGRTTKQGYSGKSNWQEIQKIKANAKVPIIGNGDILAPGAVKAMIGMTNCDGVMIGRGAIGNPFIFQMANFILEHGKTIPEPAESERKECFRKFLGYYERYENMRSFTELRQQAMWFTKGMHQAAEIKRKLMATRTIEEMMPLIKF